MVNRKLKKKVVPGVCYICDKPATPLMPLGSGLKSKVELAEGENEPAWAVVNLKMEIEYPKNVGLCHNCMVNLLKAATLRAEFVPKDDPFRGRAIVVVDN